MKEINGKNFKLKLVRDDNLNFRLNIVSLEDFNLKKQIGNLGFDKNNSSKFTLQSAYVGFAGDPFSEEHLQNNKIMSYMLSESLLYILNNHCANNSVELIAKNNNQLWNKKINVYKHFIKEESGVFSQWYTLESRKEDLMKIKNKSKESQKIMMLKLNENYEGTTIAEYCLKNYKNN